MQSVQTEWHRKLFSFREVATVLQFSDFGLADRSDTQALLQHFWNTALVFGGRPHVLDRLS
jgi:hypothetical protein